MEFNAEKFNPTKYFKNLFQVKTLFELGKNIVKVQSQNGKWIAFHVTSMITNFKKLKEAKNKVEYYEKEIQQQQETLERLHRDSALMERIAREKYMMKRDNEVIYIIEAKE